MRVIPFRSTSRSPAYDIAVRLVAGIRGVGVQGTNLDPTLQAQVATSGMTYEVPSIKQRVVRTD